MRFLKEAFGESDELDTFVSQVERRFRNYYHVALVLKSGTLKQNRYFFSEDAAREYYNNIKEDAVTNKDYYDGAELTIEKVLVEPRYEEIDSEIIGTNDEVEETEWIDEEPIEEN